MHLFFKYPHGQEKTDDRADRQHPQVNRVYLSAHEGNAGSVKKRRCGNRLDEREHLIRVNGNGEKKSREKDNGHDDHGLDSAEVFGFVNERAAKGTQAGEADTAQENEKKVG